MPTRFHWVTRSRFHRTHLGLAHWLHAVCLPPHADQPRHRFSEVLVKLEGANLPDDLHSHSGRVRLADERGIITGATAVGALKESEAHRAWDDTYSFMPSLSKIMGKHTLKVGAEFRILRTITIRAIILEACSI